MQEACGNCRFFVEGAGEARNASNHRCRRYPRLPIIRKKKIFWQKVVWEFGLTLRDDLCGEWKPHPSKIVTIPEGKEV